MPPSIYTYFKEESTLLGTQGPCLFLPLPVTLAAVRPAAVAWQSRAEQSLLMEYRAATETKKQVRQRLGTRRPRRVSGQSFAGNPSLKARFLPLLKAAREKTKRCPDGGLLEASWHPHLHPGGKEQQQGQEGDGAARRQCSCLVGRDEGGWHQALPSLRGHQLMWPFWSWAGQPIPSPPGLQPPHQLPTALSDSQKCPGSQCPGSFHLEAMFPP